MRKKTAGPWRSVPGYGKYSRFVLGLGEDEAVADVHRLEDVPVIEAAPEMLAALLIEDDSYEISCAIFDEDWAKARRIMDKHPEFTGSLHEDDPEAFLAGKADRVTKAALRRALGFA